MRVCYACYIGIEPTLNVPVPNTMYCVNLKYAGYFYTFKVHCGLRRLQGHNLLEKCAGQVVSKLSHYQHISKLLIYQNKCILHTRFTSAFDYHSAAIICNIVAAYHPTTNRLHII